MTQDEENISKSPTNEVELDEPVIFSLRLPGQGNFPQDKDSNSNNSNEFSCIRILKILIK